MPATTHAELLATVDPVLLTQRVRMLEQRFDFIARERMTGLPIVNPHLRVQALGFEPTASTADGHITIIAGVLITPWFMSLVRLPLKLHTVDTAAHEQWRSGSKRDHMFGAHSFVFLAAHDEVLGVYESCALFSPMDEFVSHADAETVALEVLRQLRDVPEPAEAVPATSATAAKQKPAVPSRRLLLFGRGAPRTGT